MIQLRVAEASQCRNKTCSLRIVDQSRIGKTYGVKPQPPETQMDFVTDLLVEVRESNKRTDVEFEIFIKQVLTTPCSGPSSLALASLICLSRSHSISYGGHGLSVSLAPPGRKLISSSSSSQYIVCQNAAETEARGWSTPQFPKRSIRMLEIPRAEQQQTQRIWTLLILSFFHHIKLLLDSMDPLQLDPNRNAFMVYCSNFHFSETFSPLPS
jgi:hypothetical protein